MIKFIDGPANGVVLELQRAPLFLRVVRDPIDLKWDALDLLDDTPMNGEEIFVYRKIEDRGTVHIDYTDKKTRRRCGKWLVSAIYSMHEQQPSEKAGRDTKLWRAWCEEQYEMMKSNEPEKGNL